MAGARRIRVQVAYDGTAYHGWQTQPGLPTVQQTIEEVLSGIEGKPVQLAGSGRTDAGVHAIGQVAAFTLENPIPCMNLRKAINRLLPEDIRIMTVEEVEADFHPRFDAVAKTYEYKIWRSEICPPMQRRWVHHHPYPLDEGALIAAASVLEGEHDFTAFAAADDRDEKGGSKVRTIFSSEAWREGELLVYRVRGSGFLKHMVRNIVGALLQVGCGNASREELRHRLTPGCGIRPGPRAPARGLCLISVEYPVSLTPSGSSE
ncbi:tRNA pseudouridine synthase A [Bryobacterales bacterium F-183]|nr:tRNA pseudouridine synthase A [Bryobacterales bacterium F-183]